MTEETKKTSLTLNRGKLELKRPLERSHIRQGFGSSSKMVQVEVRKKRTIQQGTVPLTAAQADAQQAHKIQLLKEAKKVEEQRARERAEAEARRLKEEAEEQAKKVSETAEKENAQEPLTEVPSDYEVKQQAKENKKKYVEDDEDEEEDFKSRKKTQQERALPVKRPKVNEERRKGGKINISAYTGSDDDDDDGWGQRRGRSLASIRRAREKEKLKHAEALKTAEKIARDVVIPETITVQELANRMAERAATVVKTLMNMGVMATITQTIDADTAELVAEELGHKVIRVAESDVEDILKTAEDKEEDKQPRPPVVTVMGHVDHGKTSLLDALRSTHVASGEAGGITQHIGAYQVTMPSGQKVTFIDTPGHEAFTAMRARGAKITDIVILVVAANDGVMPQTIEAINHAKAAGVPIVVAINKIDVPGANPDKVKMELLNHEVVVESLGGDVLSVEVSAKQRTNLDKLVEAVLLQAEVLDLKANPNRAAEGVVVESKMEKGRGPVATVLVSRGTLKIGDIFVVGQEWGRVRSLLNDQGQRVKEALPATPVEVVGLQGVPAAGDELTVVEDEAKAREISGYRQRKAREAMTVKRASGSTMEQMFAQIKAGETKEFPVRQHWRSCRRRHRGPGLCPGRLADPAPDRRVRGVGAVDHLRPSASRVALCPDLPAQGASGQKATGTDRCGAARCGDLPDSPAPCQPPHLRQPEGGLSQCALGVDDGESRAVRGAGWHRTHPCLRYPGLRLRRCDAGSEGQPLLCAGQGRSGTWRGRAARSAQPAARRSADLVRGAGACGPGEAGR